MALGLSLSSGDGYDLRLVLHGGLVIAESGTGTRAVSLATSDETAFHSGSLTVVRMSATCLCGASGLRMRGCARRDHLIARIPSHFSTAEALNGRGFFIRHKKSSCQA